MEIILYLYLFLYIRVANTKWPRCLGPQRLYLQFHFLIHHEAISLPKFIIPSPIALVIFPAPINTVLTG